ncbi:PPC domain-containing protein [Myxococcus sp. K38C18041901]|uniref:PPC domain-containing protein n=1 Tax=Myxococcus guangdongensis TaxID=2906760 RepID=UPI0020A6EFAB|nr:pre-peptidase C-terminal domain-containing protein [Myxococcus guangdongensis]MCP3064896.1 PPC domain-containing protein [Myxococcus guangdongensis]
MNHRRSILLLAGALLLLSACGGARESGEASTGSQTQAAVNGALTSGTPLNSLAAPGGASLVYSLAVPANQNTVTFTTSGGPGNLDMKVAFGAEPTTSNAACTSAGPDSVETCTVSARAAAGTWYVQLSATASFSNVTLTGSYAPLGTNSSPVRTLTNGVSYVGNSGVTGDWKMFSFQVPANQAVLNVAVSGGTGDADLYLRQGSTPDLTNHACRSTNTGNTESCQVTAPQAGLWYIMLRGYTAFSGVSVVATVTPPLTALVNGQPVGPLSAAQGTALYYTLEVPAGQSALNVTLAGGTGDADLYVKHGAIPTTTSYGCRSWGSTNTESCTMTPPTAGTYYVMVRASAAFSGVALLAQTVSGAEPAVPLTNGQEVVGLEGSTGGPFLYKLEVPGSVSSLRFQVTNVFSGEFAMTVKRGSPPVGTDYDCRQTSQYGSCTFDAPQGGIWYVRLTPGNPTFRYLSLKATYEGTISTQALVAGQPVLDVGGEDVDRLYFTLEVPAGQKRLAIWSTTGMGEASVYARFGSRPTPQAYTCRSSLPGSCVIPNPQAGTWHFYVDPSGGLPFYGHTLVANYTTAVPSTTTTELIPGEPSAPVSGTPFDEYLFTVQVPPHQSELKFEWNHGDGYAIYVEPGFGAPPTGTVACQYASCVFDRPAAGLWYVRVRGRTDFTDKRITASFKAPKVLSSYTVEYGVPPGVKNYYRLDVPPGQNGLSFTTGGQYRSDANLYVKQGALPSRTDYHCASAVFNTSSERCDFFDPQGGPWFALVETFSMFPEPSGWNVTLEAKYSEVGPLGVATENTPVLVSIPRKGFATYRVEVPAGQAYLLAEVIDRVNDEYTANEVWMQHQAYPTDFYLRCRGSRSCEVTSPEAGTWYITLRAINAIDGALRVTTASKHQRNLVNGMTELTMPSAALQSMTLFRLEVPAGAAHLNVNLKGEQPNNGDVDLYVRRGGLPGTSTYDCASRNASGAEETCDFANPQAGTWYVGVYTRTAGSRARLSATYLQAADEDVPSLTSHETLTGLRGAARSRRMWKLEVPEGQRLLWFGTQEGRGSPSLKVKRGSRPIEGGAVDCASVTTARGQQCVIANPVAGTWFVALPDAPLAYNGLALTGGYVDASAVTPLTNGVPQMNLVSRVGTDQYFALDVPAGESLLTFDVTAAATRTGDLSVSVAKDVLPTAPSTACVESSMGVVRCSVANPGAGTWFVKVTSTRSALDDLWLIGHHTSQVDDVPLLRSGVRTKGLSASTAVPRTFKVMVPPGVDHLAVEAGIAESGSTWGTMAVSARKGSPPTATEYGCKASVPQMSSSVCWVYDPAPGLWYVTVTPVDSYRAVWLEADAR